MATDDESQFVPVYTNFSSVYESQSSEEKAVNRFQVINDEFNRLYGESPKLFSRAPGRVNLIGEHIDYEGYAVLPMAISYDTIVAIQLTKLDEGVSGVIKVSNVDAAKYPPVEYAADPHQEVDLKDFKWSHYFLCAFKGVFDHLADKNIHAHRNFNLEVLVDGIVPLGSGLSSSAALVCSSAIAIMAAMGLDFTKSEIAEFCCKCERYIGTQSGGMDQSISILARPGVAMLIQFDPIVANPVELPKGASFIIANSLTVSKKAETASRNYNMRVVECQLAAMLLAIYSNERTPESARVNVKTLSDLSNVWDFPDGILATVEKFLHREPYTAAELESILEAPLAKIFAHSEAKLAVLQNATEFKLSQRAQHVYSEAERVRTFYEVANGSSNLSPDKVLETLGQLMNDSHSSCKDLYDCSCPELDELVSIARSNGALGSRLTGAGWGGCTVSLVKDSQLESFILALKEQYFVNKAVEGDLDSVVFASKPGAGAAIFRL